MKRLLFGIMSLMMFRYRYNRRHNPHRPTMLVLGVLLALVFSSSLPASSALAAPLSSGDELAAYRFGHGNTERRLERISARVGRPLDSRRSTKMTISPATSLTAATPSYASQKTSPAPEFSWDSFSRACASSFQDTVRFTDREMKRFIAELPRYQKAFENWLSQK